MDVTLHCAADPPEFAQPLLTALQALPEADDSPDGVVHLCLDADAVAPPGAESTVTIVARAEPLFDPIARGSFVERLRARLRPGAVFVVTTPTAAKILRAALGLPDPSVRVVAMPLVPERVPQLADGGGEDVLAVGPIAYPAVLSCMGLLRLAGLDRRCLLAAPDATRLSKPGGEVGRFGLMGGREAVSVPDWRAAAPSAAVIVLGEQTADIGVTLREALATGRPVVAPATPLVSDHLACVGASAYLYPSSGDVAGLTRAVAAALRRDRGGGLEPAARDAILRESWTDAARGLYGALHEALRPTPRARRESNEASGDGLAVCVLNPHASGGGGERFLRELVGAMARHASRPRVTLVCATETEGAFDAGAQALEEAGVSVITTLPGDFSEATQQAMDDAEIVYCSWPHLTDPPATAAPLVCTFHDVNWRRFDVMGPPEKALVERQSPLWIERSAAMVHSSQFIRHEVHEHYGAPPAMTHVIPLTAQAPDRPAGAAARAHVRRRFALPQRFLLSPAGYHLHKNYAGLDAALRRLRAQGRPVTVLATGVLTDVQYHGPDLIGLGYVTSAELQALYEESAGIVQATLYEAGSFPMAEAMVAGKPVAISRIPPIVEQVERVGVVAELFDPLDPHSMAEAIWRLWEGSVDHAVAGNAAKVAQRSWDDVAGEYLALFGQVAAERRPLSAVAR